MKQYLGIILLASLLCTSAKAEEIDSVKVKKIDLNELVVVGFKQDQTAKVPGSISNLSGLLLRSNERQSVADLSSLVPNLFILDYGSRQNTPIFIRGIGSKALSPSVIFYVDGVPSFENCAFDTDLDGVSNIEILRGPQGTLYGRNAIGGIINIYTPSPLKESFHEFKLGYGSRNDIRVSTNNSFKLSNRFGMLVQANYHHNDGFFENQFTHKKTDKLNDISSRIKMSWQMTPRWQASILGSYTYTDQNGYPYGIYDTTNKKTRDVNYNSPSFYIRTLATSGLNIRYSGDNIKFNSQTSYQFVKDHQRMDQDFTPIKLYEISHRLKQDLVSQELTLKSNNSFYSWIVGAFGFVQKKNEKVSVGYFKGIPRVTSNPMEKYQYADMTNMGLAFYHQSIFNLTNKITLTAGLRYDMERQKLDNSDYLSPISNLPNRKLLDHFDSKLNFTQFTPKVSLSYDFLNGNSVYATVARGYKAGGFNFTVKDESQRKYNPEYNWNYEIGSKFSLANNRLKGEAAIFFIDWKDQQISHVIPAIGVVLDNAGHSTSKGIELGLHYNVNKQLGLNLNYGYTDAKFKDYIKGEGLDYSHNKLPLVPTHTFSLDAAYTIESSSKWIDYATFNLGLTGTGPFYWMDNNEVKQNFYPILNLKASVTKGNITWEVWSKNTTNTHFMSNYFELGPNKYGQKGRPFSIGTSILIDL